MKKLLFTVLAVFSFSTIQSEIHGSSFDRYDTAPNPLRKLSFTDLIIRYAPLFPKSRPIAENLDHKLLTTEWDNESKAILTSTLFEIQTLYRTMRSSSLLIKTYGLRMDSNGSPYELRDSDYRYPMPSDTDRGYMNSDYARVHQEMIEDINNEQRFLESLNKITRRPENIGFDSSKQNKQKMRDMRSLILKLNRQVIEETAKIAQQKEEIVNQGRELAHMRKEEQDTRDRNATERANQQVIKDSETRPGIKPETREKFKKWGLSVREEQRAANRPAPEEYRLQEPQEKISTVDTRDTVSKKSDYEDLKPSSGNQTAKPPIEIRFSGADWEDINRKILNLNRSVYSTNSLLPKEEKDALFEDIKSAIERAQQLIGEQASAAIARVKAKINILVNAPTRLNLSELRKDKIFK